MKVKPARQLSRKLWIIPVIVSIFAACGLGTSLSAQLISYIVTESTKPPEPEYLILGDGWQRYEIKSNKGAYFKPEAEILIRTQEGQIVTMEPDMSMWEGEGNEKRRVETIRGRVFDLRVKAPGTKVRVRIDLVR